MNSDKPFFPGFPVPYALAWRNRRVKEKVGRVGSWQPVGKLAADVFVLPKSPGALSEGMRNLWAWVTKVLAERDWERLSALVLGQGEPNPGLAGADPQLARAAIARRVERALLRRLRTVAEASIPPLKSHDDQDEDAGEVMRECAQFVRWFGASKEGAGSKQGYLELFFTTPLGAVFVSLNQGIFRGRLRSCTRCGRFVAFEIRGGEQTVCDYCRQSARRTNPRAVHLGPKKAQKWRLVRGRLRRRVQRIKNLLKKRRAKKDLDLKLSLMLAALEEIDLNALNSWEQKWAPELPRGPRKRGAATSA